MPLWVADMDFAAPKAVEEALQQLVAQGTFGYAIPPSVYFLAYQAWQDRHWGTKFEEKWLSFSTGVVQSLVDLLHFSRVIAVSRLDSRFRDAHNLSSVVSAIQADGS